MPDNSLPTSNQIEADAAADRVGMALSGVCLIHCLAMPLIVGTLPALTHIPGFHHLHWLLGAFIIPLGLWAFGRGYRLHHRLRILLLGVFGLTLVTAGTVLTSSFSEYLVVGGSLVMILTHWRNLRALPCGLPKTRKDSV